MIVDGALSVVGDLSQTEFTPTHTDFARFLLPYRCAISALTTKINILKGELTHADHYCPIRAVTSRVKSPNSILGKAARIGCPLTADDIGTNILDIAGVRVTCGLISDTYRVATLLSQQADLTVIEVEDYIAHPKPNGYKSFHMVLEIPVYLSDRVERVPVELQIRTIAMDLWADLEQRVYDTHKHAVPPRLLNVLIDAAEAAHQLDETMQRLFDEVVNPTAVHPSPIGTHLELMEQDLVSRWWPGRGPHL